MDDKGHIVVYSESPNHPVSVIPAIYGQSGCAYICLGDAPRFLYCQFRATTATRWEEAESIIARNELYWRMYTMESHLRCIAAVCNIERDWK